MLTRQHYKAIAKIIKETSIDISINTDLQTTVERFRSTIGRELARYFRADNSRFNWITFIKECGLD